jgi:hypothetical protein
MINITITLQNYMIFAIFFSNFFKDWIFRCKYLEIMLLFYVFQIKLHIFSFFSFNCIKIF